MLGPWARIIGAPGTSAGSTACAGRAAARAGVVCVGDSAFSVASFAAGAHPACLWIPCAVLTRAPARPHLLLLPCSCWRLPVGHAGSDDVCCATGTVCQGCTLPALSPTPGCLLATPAVRGGASRLAEPCTAPTSRPPRAVRPPCVQHLRGRLHRPGQPGRCAPGRVGAHTAFVLQALSPPLSPVAAAAATPQSPRMRGPLS